MSSLLVVVATVVVTTVSAPLVSAVFANVLAVVLGTCEYVGGTFIIVLSSIDFPRSDCVLVVSIGNLGFVV